MYVKYLVNLEFWKEVKDGDYYLGVNFLQVVYMMKSGMMVDGDNWKKRRERRSSLRQGECQKNVVLQKLREESVLREK